MNMRVAVYGDRQIEYDADAPCWYCDLPVGIASGSGPHVCVACDCGMNRDGTLWTSAELYERLEYFHRRQKEAGREALQPHP